MALRRCIEGGCVKLTNGTRCAVHQAQWEARRRADGSLTGRRSTTSDWRQVRKRRLDIDGHQCRGCGLVELEAPKKGLRLEVHHRDGNATNHRMSNLITLCAGNLNSCHAKAEAELRSDRQANVLANSPTSRRSA